MGDSFTSAQDTEPDATTKRFTGPFLLVGVTAVAYVFSYEYQRSYLAYFGVPEDFAIIDLTTLAASGATFLLLIFIGYVTVGVFPFKLVRLFLNLLYLFWPTVLIFFFTITFFEAYGFAWVTLISGLIACLILVFTSLEFVEFSRGKLSFNSWVFTVANRERQFAGGAINHRVFDNIGNGLTSLFIIALLVAPVGKLAGIYNASSRDEYVSFSQHSQSYIVVYRLSSHLVSVPISKTENNTVVVTGGMRLVGLDGLSGQDTKQMKSRVERVLQKNGSARAERVSWNELLSRLGLN